MGRILTDKIFNELLEKKKEKKEKGEEKVKKKSREAIVASGKVSYPSVSNPNQSTSSAIENLEYLTQFLKAYLEFKKIESGKDEVLLRDLDEIKNEQRRIKDEMTRTMLEAEHTRAMINHDVKILQMFFMMGCFCVGLYFLAKYINQRNMGFASAGVAQPLPQGIYTGRVVNPMGQGVVVPPVPAWEIERGLEKKEKSLVEKIRENLNV